MILLSAKNLGISHGAGTKSILEGLHFDLKAGDFICLMGPNGSGKTTLLRALSNLNPHIMGTVQLEGREIGTFEGNEFAKKVSVVLTDQLELRHMSVYEVVSFGRFPYTNFWGTLSETDRTHVDEAIALTNLEGYANRLFDKLSDGEKQKVLIARAIAQDTPIMFLDEPTTFLDISHKLEVLTILKKLATEKKKAILFSSHDWDIVSKITESIWIFNQDKQIEMGTPCDLIKKGLLEKSFNLSADFVKEYYHGKCD